MIHSPENAAHGVGRFGLGFVISPYEELRDQTHKYRLETEDEQHYSHEEKRGANEVFIVKDAPHDENQERNRAQSIVVKNVLDDGASIDVIDTGRGAEDQPVGQGDHGQGLDVGGRELRAPGGCPGLTREGKVPVDQPARRLGDPRVRRVR